MYYSQHKQDWILDDVVFDKKEKGFFFDIGANDGVTYSNTLFLERNRSWTGICVEPLPQTFASLKNNRNCIVENCAVGSQTGKDTFMEITGYAEMLSGLKKNYNKKHLLRIEEEIKVYGGNKNEIEINIVNVNDLLAKYGSFNIDYCNIDTEGSEFEILQAIDFRKVKIDVITVEANYKIERFRIWLLLWLKGYNYIANLGNDMLFIHKRALTRIGKPADLRSRIIHVTQS